MKNFVKILKNIYFGAILGLFYPNLVKNGFCLKNKALSVFKYSNHLLSCQKSEKAEITEGQTDRRTDNGDFIGYSIGWLVQLLKYF